MRAGELTAVIDGLASGELTQSKAAKLARRVHYLPRCASGEPGGFFPVSLAYCQAKITRDQYAALARAAAASIRREGTT